MVRELHRAGVTRTTSADLRENAAATRNIVVAGADPAADAERILSLTGDDRYDVVVCAAGGWAGSSARDRSIFADTALMWNLNVQSALVAAHVACRTLRPNGLLVLTGAGAALRPCPGMLSYGISKVATHHIVQSVAAEVCCVLCAVCCVLCVLCFSARFAALLSFRIAETTAHTCRSLRVAVFQRARRRPPCCRSRSIP